MASDDQKRVIGKVISVSADKFVVEMKGKTDNFTVVGFDDIHYVAALGSFVMIRVQAEYVVAEVIGLREKESTADKDDSGTLEKALSAKYLDIVPVGRIANGKFTFGVSTFPSLYADALYARDADLDQIFETDAPEVKVDDEQQALLPSRSTAITIGSSVVFQGYDVKVRVDDYFGGHVAILGNTGSGKSCTVATIIQSLFSKQSPHGANGATFLIFDVNGEYTQAFPQAKQTNDIMIKTAVLDGANIDDRFTLPHWFLEVEEWALLLQASERTQLPVLRTALGLATLLNDNTENTKTIKQHFVARCVKECFGSTDSPVTQMRRAWILLDRYGTAELNQDTLIKYNYNSQYGNFPTGTSQQGFLDELSGFIDDNIQLPPYKKTPFPFDILEECLDFSILYEEAHGNKQIRDYCSQLMTRLKSLRDRSEFNFLKHDGTETTTHQEFLSNLLGFQIDEGGWKKTHQVIILDMNAVEDEVVELVSSVVARMTFKLLRKAENRNQTPINMVLEEAHRYISSKPSNHAVDANLIFERIAKEGRKYGLFLTVASQRPSELSHTVLSQCSNFVVHRIQNPEDLAHIRQMTPFISESVLSRLPSLPKQHALIFGNAVTIPTTFKVRNVNPEPKSGDSKISKLWFIPSDTPRNTL